MPVGDFFEERDTPEVQTQALNMLLSLRKGWWIKLQLPLVGFGGSGVLNGSEGLVACLDPSHCNKVFLITLGLAVGTTVCRGDPIQDSGNYWETGPTSKH